MEEIINDIRKALENKTYYCALALALTLPDICCHVENHLENGENSNRDMYINWFDKHISFDDFHFPIEGFETQTFDGKMCYSLRCSVLHNGNTEVQNERLGVNVDEFVLRVPTEENCDEGYRYEEKANGETRTDILINYLCERLCDAAEEFYRNWENKDDFKNSDFCRKLYGESAEEQPR